MALGALKSPPKRAIVGKTGAISGKSTIIGGLIDPVAIFFGIQKIQKHSGDSFL